MKKSKSTLAREGIKNYINECADYQIAIDRLNDKGDKVITFKELRNNINN